jgi:hypothetical protein
MKARPKWYDIAMQLVPRIWDATGRLLDHISVNDPADVSLIPRLAFWHFQGCMETSSFCIQRGRYSVCMGILRQSVEALSVIDAGLQKDDKMRRHLIREWRSNQISLGELRRELDRSSWIHYGKGLWDEKWSEFFADLSKAVQPYAHYSSNLMYWQYQTTGDPALRIQPEQGGHRTMLAKLGPQIADPEKSWRLTLLEGLAEWALGRISIANDATGCCSSLASDMDDFGTALRGSRLLDTTGDWASELLGLVWFSDGMLPPDHLD